MQIQSRNFIPSTMATQHPDNACAPYFESDGDGFISGYEEIPECVSAFEDLGVKEFMWDFEGKYTDEAVIDKLFSQYYKYFKQNQLGRDLFLTFRLPNIWKEKGYSLMRALMIILTSGDFARDLKFHTPPLFEVILPMTERASQLVFIKNAFQKIARLKREVFNHAGGRRAKSALPRLEMIPLLEGVDNQLNICSLLNQYVVLLKTQLRERPDYLRPFLARSDPAMISGLIATVLANKIALSEIAQFSKSSGIPTYPIIGVGSLPFRGGLTPDNPENFIKEYPGIRTVTVQSAFRYDYPTNAVRKSIKFLNHALPRTQTRVIDEASHRELSKLIRCFASAYQSTLAALLPDLQPFFNAVPRRRERRLHIGLLSYARKMGKESLPRAITFTGGFYSLGIPPEFIGTGRVLETLTSAELKLVRDHYVNIADDFDRAGRYVNQKNLAILAKSNRAWNLVRRDILLVQEILNLRFGPKTKNELRHRKLTSAVLLQKNNPPQLGKLIQTTGKLRGSLG